MKKPKIVANRTAISTKWLMAQFGEMERKFDKRCVMAKGGKMTLSTQLHEYLSCLSVLKAVLKDLEENVIMLLEDQFERPDYEEWLIHHIKEASDEANTVNLDVADQLIRYIKQKRHAFAIGNGKPLVTMAHPEGLLNEIMGYSAESLEEVTFQE